MDDFDSIDKTVSDILDISGTRFGDGSRPQDLKPGAMFAGRYEILSEGFRGGMGVVYQCRDIKLQKQKALKIIHPHLLKSSQALQRFRQEVSISQELLNENIVRVYDLDEYQGQEFFSMEWVEGRNLRELILERKQKGKSFSLKEADGIISQLCSALQYAHRYTVHRDIKPENIMLKDDGDKQIIKLTDFGVAKMLTVSQFTTTSIQMGTPYYMAPEQKLDTGHVDKRADIYSVGVILFELLTLENTVGPELPSDLNPQLPKEIDDVFRKAVALRPERRYGDVGELAAALSQIVSTQKDQQQQVREKEAQLKRESELAEQKEREAAEAEQRKWEEEHKEQEAEQQREEGSLNGEPSFSGEDIHCDLSITLNESLDGTEKTITLHKENNGINEIIVKIPAGIKTGQILKISGKGKPGLSGGTNGDLYIKINILEEDNESFWNDCIKNHEMNEYLLYLDRYPNGRHKSAAEAAIARILNEPYNEKKEDGLAQIDDGSEETNRFFTNSIGMSFVLLEAGTFMMGSPQEVMDRNGDETQHRVIISKSFYIQTTAVTQEHYEKVMGETPSEFLNGGINCPVENISWNDVQEFIKKLNRIEDTDMYRLPTEAEWEYACRAGSDASFCFGDDENILKEYAWYDANSDNKTHPVGQKKPNARGLYDMYGNVWEWVQDRYGEYPKGVMTDPEGALWLWARGRVTRGGSWSNNSRDCRSFIRGQDAANSRYDNVGFRLAITL